MRAFLLLNILCTLIMLFCIWVNNIYKKVFLCIKFKCSKAKLARRHS